MVENPLTSLASGLSGKAMEYRGYNTSSKSTTTTMISILPRWMRSLNLAKPRFTQLLHILILLIAIAASTRVLYYVTFFITYYYYYYYYYYYSTTTTLLLLLLLTTTTTTTRWHA